MTDADLQQRPNLVIFVSGGNKSPQNWKTMSEKTSALYSQYVIDGIRQEFSPARLLEPVTDSMAADPSGREMRLIVDETVDSPAGNFDMGSADIASGLDSVLAAVRRPPLAYPDSYTRFRIASALEDALWKKGSFRLGDLKLSASWRWNEGEVGAMAAFYESVRNAADYIDALGLRFSDVSYSRTSSVGEVRFKAVAGHSGEDDEIFVREPFRTADPHLCPSRACPQTLVPDPQSWVIYIPFDTADFRLGGSLFAQEAGIGGAQVQINDADCFIDCFEVVREFVEDSLPLCGATVGEGGMMKTLSRLTGGVCGIEADISSVLHSYQEKHALRVLFGEVPGVIIQIRDSDFDYLDAELLLQDVAYFPLGHPDPALSGVRVKASAKSGIQTILESLIRNAEGED